MYRINYDDVFEIVKTSINQYRCFKTKNMPSVLTGCVCLYHDLKKDIVSISGMGYFGGLWVHVVLVVDYKNKTEQKYINGVLYENG